MASTPATYVVAAALALLIAASGCAKSDDVHSGTDNQTVGISYGDPKRGEQVFGAICALCHGPGGSGGVGPSLIAENHRKNYEETVAWIYNPDPPMPHLFPSPLSARDVEDVASYVQSL